MTVTMEVRIIGAVKLTSLGGRIEEIMAVVQQEPRISNLKLNIILQTIQLVLSKPSE